MRCGMSGRDVSAESAVHSLSHERRWSVFVHEQTTLQKAHLKICMSTADLSTRKMWSRSCSIDR